MKISIVTAVYNGEKTLQNLINSVIQQEYSDLEFIIIDGGSKDGTLDIIKKNAHYISYWISERDKGIYDAWNKGIVKASGDWIMFLGCDDILCPNALKSYSNFAESLPYVSDLDLISSKNQMIDHSGNITRTKGWAYKWPEYLNDMMIAHPGALHSKRLFEKYGMYDCSFRIVGDYELFLRAGENLKAEFLNEITVRMGEGGVSDSIAAIKEHYRAVTTTGKHSKSRAMVNAIFVATKFIVKKGFRKVGINVYLKR